MKMLLLLLCALFSASSISAFPKPVELQVNPRCADPTFACQDLESARLCDVVKSCIHDIWATMSAPDDNDEICDICKEMVKEARDQLLSNMTQEEIKEVFEGSCKLLPIKLVADECIKIVDEIIPELVEMLASRMDPNMVCTVSGLCNMAHLPIENQLLKRMRNFLIHNGDQCTDCTAMLTDVKTFLRDTPEAQVKTYAEKVCAEKAPSYLCDLLIGKYFQEIYTYVVSNDPKEMCTDAGVCKKSCDSKEPTHKVDDELTCEFCSHVLEHIKQEIIANTTVEEFRTALLNFCKHMGSFSDKCTSAVNDYYDMIFDYIRKLDTKEFCTLIGLCNNDQCRITPLVQILPPLEARKRIPLVRIQPAQRVGEDTTFHPLVKVIPATMKNKKEMAETNEIFPMQTINALPLERLSHPVINFERDTECAFCRAITFYLQQDLKGDKSKAGVRKAMANVCDKWVKEFPEHCENFLNKYSQKVRYAIAEDIEYESICRHVKACPLEDKNSELDVKVIPPKAKEGPFCDLCKDLVGQIETKLKDPQTKKQVENLLYQACNVFPSLRDECRNFINQNIDALFSILEQELNPDNVCPALKFCTSTPRVKPLQIVNDLECDLCKEAVTSLRTKMTDPAFKETILVFIEEGCARLPGNLAQECKSIIDENIDTVIGVMVQAMDPDTICSLLKICPASLKKVSPPRVNDGQCELCKEVIGQIENLVKDKKTEDEIRAALDKVCSVLPPSLSTECEKFMDTYVETLITLITMELDPETICALLKVCPASVKKVNDVQCELCKEVIGKVEDLVKDKKTEDEIKAALDQVCSLLPSKIANECEQFVNTYAEMIITLITTEVDPEVICAALKVCPGSVKKLKDVECDLCKEVVSKVQDMVKDKKTEDEIRDALDKVCSLFPSSKLSTKCQQLVDTYLETLITLIAMEMDPAMICAALNVCPKKEHFDEWLAKAQDVECQTCQYFLHFIQEQLQNDDTQGEVKNVLKQLCSLLPATYSQNCEAFVDEYGSAFLALIAQEIDPSSLCWELKMCHNQTIIFKTLSKGEVTALQSSQCNMCTQIVDYMDQLLEQDDIDKEITALVEKVCNVIPSSLKEKCSTVVETYGPYILQMIGQMADSKQVCQDIDMCARPAGHAHLLGGHKCTFGPSYWCQSNAHAAACKAEMFCRQKVWQQ